MGAASTASQGAAANRIAQQNAKLKTEQGIYQAKQIRRKVGFINATALNQASGNGLAISGSVFDVMMDNAVNGEIDAYNTQKGAEDEAHVMRLEGAAAQTRANNTATGMMIGGFSNFLRMQ